MGRSYWKPEAEKALSTSAFFVSFVLSSPTYCVANPVADGVCTDIFQMFTSHPGFNSGWALCFLAPFTRVLAISLDFSWGAHTFSHPLCVCLYKYIFERVLSQSGVHCSCVLAFCHACSEFRKLEWTGLPFQGSEPWGSCQEDPQTSWNLQFWSPEL